MSLDDWVKIANVASPIIAFVGLGFIWYQLYSNAKQHKRERAFFFAGKYHDPEYVKYFVDAMSFIRGPFPTWQDYRNDKTTKINVGITMNFFEQLGLMYRENLIDREMIDDLLGNPVIESYKLFGWLIESMRIEERISDPEVLEAFLCYRNWEVMCKIMEENEPIYIREERRKEFIRKILPYLKLTR